ncbi:hypothetical protein Y032_0471g2046 [Ancylostoma ceylanicum]|uniref:ABC transporter domain-containing protein n=1 Tax=Ancylostoma ceylanicum TaxID=53326 RepID=A0A016WYP8_9BILA|nr:hypothetical protein Y032_0471g2046 [Ancylostoma ceylanicum]
MDERDETTSLLSAAQSTVYGSAATAANSVLDAVEPITLSWNKLRVSVTKGGRQLLHGVTGLARPGELLALMGASGAGKTTLLNTLLSRNLKGLTVEGTVAVNGNVIGRGITAISGYAQQEEMFVGTLTVREYLSIQARLRTNLPPERREKRVNVVLSQLGLTKCQNTRIGVAGVLKGISGGEARRLTFACEMLSNPALLFCDEPTTGLDSFMAENVVQVLSKLAKSGRTVVCTIHQPASQLYLMFDRVMFLAGGRTAFLGSPRECIQFFEDCDAPCPHNYNPADLIIHTLAVVPHEEDVCRQRIAQICDAYENGHYGRAVAQDVEKIPVTEVPRGRRRLDFFTQVAALLHRYCLDNLRNPSLARAKLLQKFVMGIFVGLLYLRTPLTRVGIGNLNGALFYIVCELTYSTLFGILTCLPGDYPLVVREYHDGIYYIFSYYLARILSYIPLFSVDGLLMLYVCYWMVGFSSSVSQVLFATLIAFLIEQSSSAFGVMLSCISPTYPVAASLAGPLLTLLSLTGGLYANVGSLPSYVSWIQYLSWFRYGFEALAINQWEEVNGANSTFWNDQRRDEVLAQFSFKADRFMLDQLLMVAFIIAFYTIGYVGLSIRVFRSR